MRLGLSKTGRHGLPKTAHTAYQKPGPFATRQICLANRGSSNHPNIQESYGFLLTFCRSVDKARALARALPILAGRDAVVNPAKCPHLPRPYHSSSLDLFQPFRSHSMNDIARRRGKQIHAAAIPSRQLTEVKLTWTAKQQEHWIRFGRAVEDQIISRAVRIKRFRANSIFAFVRWESNAYGTVSSRIDVVRAVATSEPFTTLPFVSPGGEILLHVSGWLKVEQVLRAIDAVEAEGVDPCDAAPDHWRHVHNRLVAGQAPRTYTMERHRAWQEIGQ
jgi:Protein of unknown function (DUF2840)